MLRRDGHQLDRLAPAERDKLMGPALAEIAERVRTAPRGGRSVSYVEGIAADIPRSLEGAIVRVYSRGKIFTSEPTYPDTSVSLQEGETQIEAALASFTAQANHYLAVWKRENIAMWLESRSPSNLLLKPHHAAKPRHLLLAVEVGGGKTRRAVRRALRDLEPSRNRIIFVVRVPPPRRRARARSLRMP